MTRRFKMLGMVFGIVLLPTTRASAAPEPVLCDEPAGSCPGPAIAVASAPLPPRPRWQPRLSLAAISGVGAHGFLFGSSSGPAPYLGGELRVMWQKHASVVGLGFRLGATSTLGSEGSWAGAWEDGGSSSSRTGALRVLGFDAAFVFSASWFWLSSGIGVMHVQDLRPGRSSDTTMPDATLALGLDIPLGDHFALRLYGQAATILVSARLNAGGGLVVRF